MTRHGKLYLIFQDLICDLNKCPCVLHGFDFDVYAYAYVISKQFGSHFTQKPIRYCVKNNVSMVSDEDFNLWQLCLWPIT